MRMNVKTALLVLASAIILIVGGQILSQPAATPATTPTAVAEGAGAVFPDIAVTEKQGELVRVEIVEVATSQKVVLTKDAASVWTVAEASNPQTLATDQTKAIEAMTKFASLAATQSFTSDQLASFGLDVPKFMLTLTDKAGTSYSLQIGNKTPANPRYYALAGADASKVYVLPQTDVDALTKLIAQPPYVPSPTPTATATSTPNPFSEVEMTATAAVEQTLAAQILQETMQAAITPTLAATAEATEPISLPATATP